MDLNQVIYTVFRAEFESGSQIGPKPTQNPILTNFQTYVLYKNPDFYRAAASARGLLNCLLAQERSEMLSREMLSRESAIGHRLGRRKFNPDRN